MRCFIPMLMLLGLAATACSDDEAACGEPPEDFIVDAGDVGHTCRHVTDGPFGDVTALSAGATDGPLLENEHMFYTVTLADDGSGNYTGAVTFRPPFDATYVFNLSEEVPVEVMASDDQTAPCRASSQSLSGCQGLTFAELFTVERRRTYTVTFGPTSSETIQVVVEEHIKPQN